MRWLFVFLLFPCSLFSHTLNPWFERDLEIYPYASFTYQHYDKIGSLAYSSNDVFWEGGAFVSYNGYAVDARLIGSDTRFHNFAFDQFLLTGIAQLLSDIAGDFTTLNVGLTLSKVSKNSVRDPSTLTHGRNQVELFVSAGNEWTCRDTWLARFYSECGLGVGDHGSPWIQGLFVSEMQRADSSRYRLFLKGKNGFGNSHIDSISQFRTYGSVDYTAVDLGVGVRYPFALFFVDVEFATRLYARQCPKKQCTFRIEASYPFGL